MVHLSFTSLAIVAAVAFAAPLALGLAPALRLPSVVLEIVLGIVVGPSVLGWVHVDPPVEVLSLLGLAFLLLLAGLEVEFDMLRGQLLRLTAAGFVADVERFVAADRIPIAGFAAARAAELRDGPAAYEEERLAQANWLAERLGLKAGDPG